MVYEILQLHLNQIYFYNLAKHISVKIEKLSESKNETKLIYIPSNYYTPDYIQYTGSIPKKYSPYYFQMFLTFYLQERGVNASYLVNKMDYRPSLIYKIVEVVDNYEERKNNHSFYPRDEKQRKTVLAIKKIITWIESFKLGKNWLKSVRENKNIDLKSNNIGDYYINTTSYKKPDYLILSNINELEVAKLANNVKIVLVMPEKIDK